jgi:catalase
MQLKTVAAIIGGALAVGSLGAAAEDAVDTADMIAAVDGLFGYHEGYRAVHAKGFCGEGHFTATSDAAGISKASMFDGQTVPVMFRYSLTPGLPTASDSGEQIKSLVARFTPEDGDTLDLLTLSVPMVFMNHPSDFAGFFRALTPDPDTGKPDPDMFKAFFDANPESQRFLEFMATVPIHASYAEAPYFAVHTFYFTNDDGERRPARWLVEPLAGESVLDEDVLETAGDDFLQAELSERLGSRPVDYDLYLQFPEEGDPLDDASVAWPAEREKVNVGRLTLTSVDPIGEVGPCDQEMFDPTGLPEGIEPSDDPVLLVRAEAYAVSFSRRLGN